MKIQHLEKLNDDETEVLVNAIPLIAVLIAGADGHIDSDEKSWAGKVAKIRTYSNPPELHDYYLNVGDTFAKKLEKYIQQLPDSVESRNKEISSHLSLLNEILPKLDPFFGATLYKSLLSFAKHVAKASGGILGFGSISRAESQWIGLPMITPIIAPDKD